VGNRAENNMTMNSFNNCHPFALHEGFQKYISVLEALRLYGTDVAVMIPAAGKVSILLMAPNDNFRKMDTENFKVFPAGTWDVGTIGTAVMDLTRYWSGAKATKVTGMVFPCAMQHLAERYMYWLQYVPEDGEAHPYTDFLAACDPWFDEMPAKAAAAGVFYIDLPAGHIAKVRAALLRAAAAYFMAEGRDVSGLVGDYKIHHQQFTSTAEPKHLFVTDRVAA
jgi:hypothetical protein